MNITVNTDPPAWDTFDCPIRTNVSTCGVCAGLACPEYDEADSGELFFIAPSICPLRAGNVVIRSKCEGEK